MFSNPSYLNALPDAFLLLQQDQVLWANASAGKLLQRPSDGLVGCGLDTLLAPGEQARLKLLQQQREAGWHMPDTFRVRFLRGSGEVTADVRFAFSESDSGQVMVLSARDVSDEDRAGALMNRLADLSTRATQLLDVGALLDAAEPIFLALGWNAAFTQILEGESITVRMIAPADDPVGDYGRSLLEHRKPFSQTPILEEVARTGRALFLDNVPTFLSGAPSRAMALSDSMSRARILRSVWCPVRTGAQVSHLLSVFGRDLTQHDFVAVQLFAAQLGAAIRVSELKAGLVARERLAAVGEMAAVLAHEVRNPVGVITNVFAALEQQANPLPPESSELLRMAYEEAGRLGRLVSDLLDFTRPLTPRLASLDVTGAIEEADRAVRQDPSLTAPGEVVLELSSTLPLAQADPLMLRRVLVNVLLNAHQHVRPGGQIRVSAEHREGEIQLVIFNQGRPIPLEVQRRVFEPFFTTRSTGTGLGLAVVWRIMEAQRGAVSVASTDEGVGFTLTLRPVPAG